ncbi:MAG: Lrp/AsnC ligand binding domain-containing protein [Candidatus Omnitrophica bacterium]|nr:Lrp/AsnC ligand binding domain-containing protein [Candidatus Omnitrophota bacterium]MDE2231996.1 Lrp/AsnC ligand binding domain-containing protein [Candidatus Omnitrophota bacterium]
MQVKAWICSRSHKECTMSKLKPNSSTTVRALIEVSITPQKDVGFDSIAERIYSYPQVESCYLVSGGYDLLVVVEGENIHTVADFVAAKLSSMANVRQTATHFLLRKYKEEGRIMKHPKSQYRPNIS